VALVRIAVGLVVAYDLAAAACYGVVDALWAHAGAGGMGLVEAPPPLPPRVLWAIATVSALTLAAGLWTRTSAAALLVVYSVLAKILPEADRGIDLLLRHALLLLALSGAGRTLSLDARLREGTFVSDAHVPAWPRYLLIVQLASVYFFAGWQKISPQWTSVDGWSALYFVLRDPHYATFDLTTALDDFLPLLRVATLATVVWERSALLLLLAVWARESGSRRGWSVRVIRRSRYFACFVTVGVVFHVSLAIAMNLGIFPWGCLALYPALFRPQDFHSLAARLGGRRAGHGQRPDFRGQRVRDTNGLAGATS
jgi:hypothetical protein